MQQGDSMKKRLFFLPNSITIFRFILTVLFMGILAGRLILGSIRLPAVLYILFVFICLSDFIDGAVARRLKAESVLGGILDISADCLFIFSSLVIFNLFRVLPVWFTAVVFVDFLVFLATSRFLIRMKRGFIWKPFVFDVVGRIAAVLFYLIPVAACMVYSHPGYESLFALNVVLLISAFLAGVSMSERCVSCFATLRYVRQK